MQDFRAFVVFVVLVVAAACSGAMYMPGAWYAALHKPAWTPPDWLFPVAWTVLYTMIAFAGWLAWKSGGWSAALWIWGVGLVLNGLWSYLMFGRHDIALALADITGLWLATAAFIWAVRPVDGQAAAFFAPYLAWVTFAAALNFAIWRMN